MPRLSKAEQDALAALEASKAAGTVPRDNSMACRRCGMPHSFDPPADTSDVMTCDACAATNLIPEELR